MHCIVCRGRDMLEEKSVTFTTDLGNCVLIVRHVPARVCRQCGETFFVNSVSIHLEEIGDMFKNAITEIAVVNYQERVA